VDLPRSSPSALASRKRYNSGVEFPIQPEPHAADRHQHRRAIYAAESTGLLILALLLLVFTVVRYWRDIPWSAR